MNGEKALVADNPQTTADLAEDLRRYICLKMEGYLDRIEVEKLAFGSEDNSPSIYQEWWDDKPHQILARVLKGKIA